ncbi:MAG: hypothetical protein ACFFAE_17270 [Candidatus Hodarchaeota archaeon]
MQKLHEACKLLNDVLQAEIVDLELSTAIYQLRLTFTTGAQLFIRYNEFEEYGYQLIISKKKYDTLRFDNFDDRWPVSSKPHYFHPKENKPVRESPMVGSPSRDMPKLITLILDEIY